MELLIIFIALLYLVWDWGLGAKAKNEHDAELDKEDQILHELTACQPDIICVCVYDKITYYYDFYNISGGF